MDKFSEIIIKTLVKNIGRGTTIRRGFTVDLPCCITIGDNCYIGPHTIITSEFETGFCILSNNVHIVGRCCIDMSGGIEIGENTFISEQVTIYTHDHGYYPRSKPRPTHLKIGKNVWLGAKCIILPGVAYIGNNAIVGLGAVVTKPVNDNEIVAGNPARVVGYIK